VEERVEEIQGRKDWNGADGPSSPGGHLGSKYFGNKLTK
jgi:hypothetical protein